MSATRTPRLAAWLLALPLCAPLAWLGASWLEPQPEIWAHLRGYVLRGVVRDTLALATLLGLQVSVLGIGLAWLTARCEFPARRWLEWALVLPLAMPGYVAAFAYVGLLDYAGPVQSAWRALSGTRAALPDVRGVLGAATILALVLYPYVYLLVRAAFLRQGAAAFDAARTLGRSPTRAFFQVALPLARPAWIAGLTLALLETLADFGTVSILGVDTFTTAIYKTWFGLNSLSGAAQLSVVLLATVATLLLCERALRGRARRGEASSRRSPRIVLRGAGAFAATTAAALVFALGFLVPLLRLLGWALQRPFEFAALSGVAFNTVMLGVAVALLVVSLGLALASLERSRPHDRWLLAPVFGANLGYAVPGTVLAVGVMLLLLDLERFAQARFSTSLLLSSSLAAVVLALALRFLRVGYDSAEVALRTLRPELIESARTLGVGRLQRLRRLVLPLLRPSLLAGLLLVAVEVMKEMPATLMLRPFGWDTLAVKIYAYTSEGLWHEAAWPALLLVAVGLLPVRWLVRAQGQEP
jgi:iron(III) transport system permease protein